MDRISILLPKFLFPIKNHMTMKYTCLSGKGQVRYGTNIQAAINYLRKSEKTGALDKTDKHFKREETERLKNYIENQNLWIRDIDLNNYISEGAEQKVYLKDSRSVIKLNDAVYYLSWIDYFI